MLARVSCFWLHLPYKSKSGTARPWGGGYFTSEERLLYIFNSFKSTIKDKGLGQICIYDVSQHVKVTRDRITVRPWPFPDPHPLTMLSPLNKTVLWISTLSWGVGGVSKMG